MRQIITCPHCGATVTLEVEGVEEGQRRAAYIGSTVSLVEMARDANYKAMRMADRVAGFGDVANHLAVADQEIEKARNELEGRL